MTPNEEQTLGEQVNAAIYEEARRTVFRKLAKLKISVDGIARLVTEIERQSRRRGIPAADREMELPWLINSIREVQFSEPELTTMLAIALQQIAVQACDHEEAMQ